MTKASGSIDLKSLKVAGEPNKYVTMIDGSGVRVHEAGAVNSNFIQLNSYGMQVYKGGIDDVNRVAEFGSIVRIGSINKSQFVLTDDSIKAYGINQKLFLEVDANKGSTQVTYIAVNVGGITLPTSSANGLSYTIDDTLSNGTIIDVNFMRQPSQNLFYSGSLQFTYGTSATSSVTLTDNSTIIYATYDGANIINHIYSPSSNILLRQLQIKYTVIATAPSYIFGSGIATGVYSLSEGKNTIASGDYSHAEGYKTTTEGDYSHGEGYITIAASKYSHSEGRQTQALGESSHSEGQFTYAGGNYSHSEGYIPSTNQSKGTYGALGRASHNEGWNTIAKGDYSHAEGYSTQASGIGTHAEGSSTTATSDYYAGYSHAEGYMSTAEGHYSHAQNEGTTTEGPAQTAIGRYNIEDSQTQTFTGDGSTVQFTLTEKPETVISVKVGSSYPSYIYSATYGRITFNDPPSSGATITVKYSPNNYALIIGNGTGWSNCSNALTVDWIGNVTANDYYSKITTLNLGTYVANGFLSSSCGAIGFSIPTGRVFPDGTTISKITFTVTARVSRGTAAANAGIYCITSSTDGSAGNINYDSTASTRFYNASGVQKTLTTSITTIGLHGGTNIYIYWNGDNYLFGANSLYINNKPVVLTLTGINVTFNIPTT